MSISRSAAAWDLKVIQAMLGALRPASRRPGAHSAKPRAPSGSRQGLHMSRPLSGISSMPVQVGKASLGTGEIESYSYAAGR